MTNRARYDMCVYKNDTWDGLLITINSVDDYGNSEPIDLTDTSITMQIKIYPTDELPSLQLSTTNNTITISDATHGMFRINPLNITLSAGTYYYDIQFNFTASNKVKTYMFGTFNIVQDITKLV